MLSSSMMTSPPLINPPPPWPSSSSSSISSLLAASRSSSHNNNGNINGNINGNNNNNKKQPKQRQVQAAYVDHTYTDYSLLSEYELQLLENNDETNTHNNDEESSDASSARGITRASSLPPGGVATTTPSGDEDSNNDNNNYCTDNNNDDSQQQQQQQQQQINSSNKKRRIELRTKLLHCMTDTYGPVKKNAGGVVHTFPSKLFEVLNRTDLYDIIHWMPHGRAFVVSKPQLFASNILPRYFKQTKYLSFTRQLNLWGYKRITRGLDAGAYYHELFLRYRPSLVRWMKRCKIKGTGMKLTPNPTMEPNFYTDWPTLVVGGAGSSSSEEEQLQQHGDGDDHSLMTNAHSLMTNNSTNNSVLLPPLPPLPTNYNVGSSNSIDGNMDGNHKNGRRGGGKQKNVVKEDTNYTRRNNNKRLKQTASLSKHIEGGGAARSGCVGNEIAGNVGMTIGGSVGGRGGMNNSNISDSVMLSVLLQQQQKREQERDDVAAAINGMAILADASSSFLPSSSLYTTGGIGSNSISGTGSNRHQATSSNEQNYSTSTMGGLPSYLQADSAMLSALLRRERTFTGGVGGSIQQLGQSSSSNNDVAAAAAASAATSSNLQNYASMGIPSFLQGGQQQMQHLPQHMMLSSRGRAEGNLVGGIGPQSSSLSSRQQQLESVHDNLMRSQMSSNAFLWGGRGLSQFQQQQQQLQQQQQQQQQQHHHNMMMPMRGGRNFDSIPFAGQFTSASASGGGGGLQNHQQHIPSTSGRGGNGQTTTNTAMESLGLMGSLQHSTANSINAATFAREMENKMHNDLAALVLHQQHLQQHQYPVSVSNSTGVGNGNGISGLSTGEMIHRPQHHQQHQQQQLSSDRLLMERLRNLDKLKQVKSDFDTLYRNNNPPSSPLPLTTTSTRGGGSVGNSAMTNTDIHSSLMHALREADHLEKMAQGMRAKARSLAVAGAWSQLSSDGVIGGGGGGGEGLRRSPSASSLATMTHSLPGHQTTAAVVDEKWRQLLHVTDDASVTEGVAHHQ